MKVTDVLFLLLCGLIPFLMFVLYFLGREISSSG